MVEYTKGNGKWGNTTEKANSQISTIKPKLEFGKTAKRLNGLTKIKFNII